MEGTVHDKDLVFQMLLGVSTMWKTLAKNMMHKKPYLVLFNLFSAQIKANLNCLR
jgi:hypothetical protein